MKIGINLVGISYLEPSVNWNNTKYKIQKNFINCWQGHDVSVYTTTYGTNAINELLDFYKPKKYTILSYFNSDQRLTYLLSLLQLIREDIDIIISSRYDIDFFKELSTYPIHLDKFNFLFREKHHWDDHNFVTDNLFIFPKRFLIHTIEAVRKLYFEPYRECCSDLHPMYRIISELIGNDNINFLSSDHENSLVNSHYKLNRNDTNIT